jgi:S-adenosylmethionine decarboxylase
MHVIVDGYGGDPQQLSDENALRALLDQYPQQMGMAKIAPPTVVCYKGSKPEDWGISGFVMIAESHISIHTFPERGLLWADIFSCKGFESASFVEDLRHRFRLHEVQVSILERGLEYPAALRDKVGAGKCAP